MSHPACQAENANKVQLPESSRGVCRERLIKMPSPPWGERVSVSRRTGEGVRVLRRSSPNCVQEILDISFRARQNTLGLGDIAEAQIQQLVRNLVHRFLAKR